MDRLHNQFKARLQSNEVLIGLWSGLASTVATEICAQSPFDFILFDAEHAPLSDKDIFQGLQAVAAYDILPVVRPVNGHTDTLKRYCDVGVQNFLIPKVDDALQATSIVEGVCYPPKGIRGLGTSLARASRWNQIPDYVKRANQQMCVICQIETKKGLENLKQIAAVDGVDMLFIGPSDLGAALGYPEPKVLTGIVEQAIADIRASGKHAGVFAVDPKLAAHYTACGAVMIGAGTDCGILAQGAVRLAESFRHGGTEKGDY